MHLNIGGRPAPPCPRGRSCRHPPRDGTGPAPPSTPAPSPNSYEPTKTLLLTSHRPGHVGAPRDPPSPDPGLHAALQLPRPPRLLLRPVHRVLAAGREGVPGAGDGFPPPGVRLADLPPGASLPSPGRRGSSGFTPTRRVCRSSLGSRSCSPMSMTWTLMTGAQMMTRTTSN
jgi:hypothetical protein